MRNGLIFTVFALLLLTLPHAERDAARAQPYPTGVITFDPVELPNGWKGWEYKVFLTAKSTQSQTTWVKPQSGNVTSLPPGVGVASWNSVPSLFIGGVPTAPGPYFISAWGYDDKTNWQFRTFKFTIFDSDPPPDPFPPAK